MQQKLNQNILVITSRFIFRDIVGQVLYWPIWWYTVGLKKTATFIEHEIIETEQGLGLTLWLKNIFIPMYGQYDWQGRLISIFMRIVVLIFKIFVFFIWLVIWVSAFILWLTLPILAVYQVTANFIFFFR